jgi:hypothetical protein
MPGVGENTDRFFSIQADEHPTTRITKAADSGNIFYHF